MTDYIYSLSLASQTRSFLFSLGFGFLMGAVYDTFRIIRLCISKGRKTQIFFDIAYCILLAFLTFIFFITINEGEIRIYLLLGEAIGFFAYGLSLGTIVFSFSKKLVDWISGFFKILCAPLRKLSGKIRQKLAGRQKRDKNLKNKWKIHLKLNKNLLYNLCVKKQNLVDENFNKKDV